MKVTVDKVEEHPRHRQWHVHITRTADVGEEEDERPLITVVPYDMLEWRAAEYGIDPGDRDTLVDIMICEQFIPHEHHESENSLYNAVDTETARKAYLAEIAKAKLKYRISTRMRDGKEGPLSVVRKALIHDPLVIALKSADVMLAREGLGKQKLDPHVKQTLRAMVESARQGRFTAPKEPKKSQ